MLDGAKGGERFHAIGNEKIYVFRGNSIRGKEVITGEDYKRGVCNEVESKLGYM